MKLREIKIHNFRALRDVTVGVSDYGLLIGANNAGKSSVIDAIRVTYGDLKYDATRDRPKPTSDAATSPHLHATYGRVGIFGSEACFHEKRICSRTHDLVVRGT